MSTISCRFPDEIDHRLAKLSEEIDRSKSYIIKQAVEEFLAEKEEYLIALSRLSKGGKRYSLSAVEEELDLDN
jgi:RHH-type transcriptional regulator, rel operon repressor / antitoxin RelB